MNSKIENKQKDDLRLHQIIIPPLKRTSTKTNGSPILTVKSTYLHALSLWYDPKPDLLLKTTILEGQFPIVLLEIHNTFEGPTGD